MATARKLPSGSWRCYVYIGMENGKRKYKSFTAKTKKDAEYNASMYLNGTTTSHVKNDSITFKEASNEYMKLKKNVLSPSTLRGYTQMESYFKSIDNMKISKISNAVLEKWINDFSADHSPKTVINAYGYIKSVLKNNGIILETHKLPQKITPEYNIPSDEEIKKMIQYCKDKNDKDLQIAVSLAAFCMMRRSEICGLSADDIVENRIHIKTSKVKGDEHDYRMKTTKNISSDRYVIMPDFVKEILPKTGMILCRTPDAITRRFKRMITALGIVECRFHDLRHYSASVMHANGIPDQYIMERGGWKSDKVLKQVYRNTMSEYSVKYTDKTNEYFESMHHEMHHGK